MCQQYDILDCCNHLLHVGYFMYGLCHTKLIYRGIRMLIPDPLGERSPLPVSPSLWPALEESEDWEGILHSNSSLPTKVSVI